MTEPAAPEGAATVEDLQTRIDDLEHERQNLQTVIDILQEVSGSLHFVDILQAITRRIGERYGLDRCSIFLGDRSSRSARLAASYEDPSIRNFEVDLDRYPEVKEAFQTGETVFIPDVRTDPRLKHVQGVLKSRRVKSVTIVPITWREEPVGAIFIRTYRSGAAFSDADVRFIQVVADIAARALKNAHRYEKLLKNQDTETADSQRAARRRIAFVAFMKRLYDAYMADDAKWGESQLSKTAGEELDRLVEIALEVFAEESKAR